MTETIKTLELEKLRLEVEGLKVENQRAQTEAEHSSAKLAAEAEKASAEALMHRLDANQLERQARRLITREKGRTVHFRGAVDQNTTSNCRLQLADWHAQDKSEGREPSAFTIVFNSPGGSVFDGFALFDEIRVMSEVHGHHITTKVRGMAASMAGVLLQAGDVRMIGPESRLHIHEPATLSMGKMSEIQDEAKLLDQMFKQMCRLYADRSGGKTTATKLYNRVKRNELWFSAKDALAEGFADQIG